MSSFAQRSAAVPASVQAAHVLRVLPPVPIAVPRAPAIIWRKQPHGAPALWS
jgi:hypothetical protein